MKNGMGYIWTEAMVDMALYLHRKGHSSGSAARVLNQAFGTELTRNSVIGKWSRLGLSRDQTTISATRAAAGRKRHRQQRQDNMKPKTKPNPLPVYRDPNASIWQPLPGTTPVSLIDLTDMHCRWPIGDPVTGYCGCDRQPGSSYCATHFEMARPERAERQQKRKAA